MAGFLDSLADGIKNAGCQILGDYAKSVSWARDLYRVPNYVPNPVRSLNCVVCNDCGPQANETPPPFTGGQCVGVPYNVRFFINNPNTVPQRTETTRVFSVSQYPFYGPIRGLVRLPGNNSLLCQCNNASGQPVNVSVGASVTQAAIDNGTTFGLVNATRFDGQVDTCGNPTPNYPVPPVYVPVPVVVPVTYDDDGGNPVTIAPEITIFAPIIGSFNNVYAPVRVKLPDLEFTGNIQVYPTLEVNIFPEGFSSDPGTGDPDPSVDPDPSPPPDPISRLRIVGVHVRASVTSDIRASFIAQADTPDLYVPRIGVVSFRVRTGARSSWTADLPIKMLRQYIPCPEPRGAIDVRFTAEPGATIAIAPVRAQVD